MTVHGCMVSSKARRPSASACKKWRVLRKLRRDPHRITPIAQAIATLNHQERQSG